MQINSQHEAQLMIPNALCPQTKTPKMKSEMYGADS